jgi:hypothetical protein
MSHFDSIYTAYVAAVFILFGCYVTQVVNVSELTVFAIVQSAVLWTIVRLLYLFMFSWDSTHLFAAIFLVAVFGGVIFYFMPPFIRDILGNFLADRIQNSGVKPTLDIESILKEGVPEE